jgi:branched-chain amino acid transport system ATP-binding protein
MLQTTNASIRFGGLTAVSDLNVTVNAGEIVGLIGPNGAGKTTVFNMLTGIYKPTGGTIRWDATDIARLTLHQITELGFARTFQNIRLFREMTVLENVMVAENLRMRVPAASAILHLPGYLRKEKAAREDAEALLALVGLADHLHDPATSLPYGMQRRLEIVRALATKPRLLLLDEPAAGMNPQESQELMDFIRQIQQQFDLSVLLIEHHMQVVMGVCHRIYVLEYGITIADGTPEEIQANQRVINAYLGAEDA